MKLTKKTGFGIAALVVALMGSAAIADKHGPQDGPQNGPMGGPAMKQGYSFDTVDANKDGKITPDELTAWQAAQVTTADTNADGKLSVDELAAAQLKAMTAMVTTHVTEMVTKLDPDGDKMLSAAEIASAPIKKDMFSHLDTNNDGVVDKAEADAAARMIQHGHGRHGGHDQNGNNQNGNDSENTGGN